MSYVSLAKAVRKGKTLRCKYPKHGRLNVLKWHEGVITRSGTGPNGKYAVVQSDDVLGNGRVEVGALQDLLHLVRVRKKQEQERIRAGNEFQTGIRAASQESVNGKIFSLRLGSLSGRHQR